MGLRFSRPVALNTWVNISRIRRRLDGHKRDFKADFDAWLAENAAGRSFVDVGGMWGDLWAAFDAEQHGATPTTMLDVTAPTDACREEIERRGGSRTRMVTGDVHDPEVLREVGAHDLVMCSGVLYHCPNPLLTLERLRSITSDRLFLSTATLEEIPGFPNGCIFYPGLKDQDRLAFADPIGGLAEGLHTPFYAELEWNNWWWGFSRSALRGMMAASGWEVLQQRDYRWPPGFRTILIAQPAPAFTQSASSDAAQLTPVRAA